MHLTNTDHIYGSKEELNLIDDMKANMIPNLSPLKGSFKEEDNSRRSSEIGQGMINNSTNPSFLGTKIVNEDDTP